MSKKRDIDVSKEADLIWKVANDVLRDIFQRTEYPDIIYPMVLIRRLECVLSEEIDKVETKHIEAFSKMTNNARNKFVQDQLFMSIGYANESGYNLQLLKDEGESSIKSNFISYLNGFHSKKVKGSDKDQIQQVINSSGIRKHVDKLSSNDILYSLIEEFANIDLRPKHVSNIKMGYIFEELVRRFSEQNNAEAGEHYTPREVIDLMVELLDIDERKLKAGELVTIYDPACGTGGMLTSVKEYIEANVNEKAEVRLYGQEVNDKTWSICEADLMIKGENAKVVNGDTLTDDGFPKDKFDYMISNPPYGKSWSKIKKKVMDRSNGRFDIGQPRTSDGQLLFTLHMVSKMKEAKNGGSAIAIVHNGSPLFSGDAGSGESKIREHVIANDLLETIVALPTQLFYNTGIATYIWILRNNKPNKRKGKIQLINAVGFWEKMSPSLGNKRRKVVDKDVARIIELHKKFEENEYSKIYDLDDFAYRKVSIELEELDEDGLPLTELRVEKLSPGTLANVIEASEKELKELKDKKKKRAKEYTFKLKKDSDFIKKTRTRDPKINIKKSVEENKLSLFGRVNVPVFVKDTELIPWKENREDWLNREVEKKWHYLSEKKGYEIPFTKEFYVYQPLRKLEEVLGEFSEMERENQSLLSELGIEL